MSTESKAEGRTAAELLADLEARGIRLEPHGGKLRVRATEQPDPEALELLKAHKHALLALLAPQRDAIQDDCPRHWSAIPLLPPKGTRAPTGTPEKPERYRVKLFGLWYLLRFEPSISEMTISVADPQAKRRMFADLDEFYRWAWAERYAAGLKYREVN